VIRLLERQLPDLVDYDFTARMEDELDTIAEGALDPTSWLSTFFFGTRNGGGGHSQISTLGLERLVKEHAESIDPRTVSRFDLGSTPEGETVVVRVGRYGPYVQIGDSERRAGVPDDLPPDELTVARALELIAGGSQDERRLGEDPETGKAVLLKNGRYGWYVQLGENGGNGKAAKPKMASLWPSMSPEGMDLERALLLLAFPRELGAHPEKGTVITAQDGRFGPYLKMGDETRSLPDHDSLLSVTLAEAVHAFNQPKPGRRSGVQVVKELGEHPESGLPLTIKSGRFGPYVTDGQVNASVPKGRDPEAVTLDDAVRLIANREAKLKAQGKDPRAPKKKPVRKRRK
jgi:DNA topoisomerase-1